MHIRESKQQLRNDISRRITRMSEQDRRGESRTICRVLLKELPRSPITIAAYYPLKTEIDLLPLIKDLLERGDRIFLPTEENEQLVMRQIQSTEDVTMGSQNIPVPQSDAPKLDPKNLDVALIPGRAFDRSGNRLGRGNGGYDFWIRDVRAANPRAKFWGTCFECQLVNEVPVEEHDEQVDAVVTDRGIIHC